MEKAPTSNKAFSKSIWKLPVPNRIRAFAWRACKNIPPAKTNLFHRHVTQHANCDECGLEAETSGHLVLALWASQGSVVSYGPGYNGSCPWIYGFGVVCSERETDDGSLFSVIDYDDMGELGRRTAAQIARWTKDYLEEFQTENYRPQHFQHQQTTGWSLPHPLNDIRSMLMGAIFESLNGVGIGVIIRDHYGLVTASLSKKIKAQLGRLEIEARAMEEKVCEVCLGDGGCDVWRRFSDCGTLSVS